MTRLTIPGVTVLLPPIGGREEQIKHPFLEFFKIAEKRRTDKRRRAQAIASRGARLLARRKGSVLILKELSSYTVLANSDTVRNAFNNKELVEAMFKLPQKSFKAASNDVPPVRGRNRRAQPGSARALGCLGGTYAPEAA
jgi:hypothetical protein